MSARIENAGDPDLENALIIVPRARQGQRADPVFDELRARYEEAAPWRDESRSAV